MITTNDKSILLEIQTRKENYKINIQYLDNIKHSKPAFKGIKWQWNKKGKPLFHKHYY